MHPNTPPPPRLPQDPATQQWHCAGLDASLEAVRRMIKERGPFDGFLGFSQGGAMVSGCRVVRWVPGGEWVRWGPCWVAGGWRVWGLGLEAVFL